jgi:hypothetical protein
MPIVRFSRGAFAPELFDTIQMRLTESRTSLEPALKQVRGLQHYYAGIDAASNTMVNISVWDTLAYAQQMDTLAPMLSLAQEFIGLGVQFERPIINYTALWEL